jgi:hypothetical protein
MYLNKSICPGCGLELKSDNQALDKHYNASCACRQLYDELSSFTLSIRDNYFIHQLVVDTYAAQHSGLNVKPITTAFSLIGLYLTFERGYTGKEVQRAHMILGKAHRQWPLINPPKERASLTVLDVVRGLTGENYRERLDAWGKSVWLLWSPQHENISKLVKMYLTI